MISFFVEDVTLKIKNKNILKSWIKQVCTSYNCSIGTINYIFCSDEYLLEINKTYLEHDYYTDIITFDLSENAQQGSASNQIAGEIYISFERVVENATIINVPKLNELYRVMIHGILHLLGRGDKTAAEKKKMRLLENEMLAKLEQIIVSRET